MTTIDIHQINSLDQERRTYLTLATINKSYDIINYILTLDGVDFNNEDIYGKTFLDYLDDEIDLTDFLQSRKMLNINRENMLSKYDKILSTYPVFYKDNLTEELRLCLINDDIELFKIVFISVSENFLCLACEYNATKIAKFCIENNFGINYLTNLNNSAFTYICFNNNLELATLLLNNENTNKSILIKRNHRGISPIVYINNISMNNIKKEIFKIRINDTILEEDIDFKIYEKDDFTFIDYENKTFSGGYGEVVHVIENSTGKDMIIKFYKSEIDFFETTDLKEISYLKLINKIYPHVATKLYGIVFFENKIHLVQEYLYYTLEEMFQLIKTFEPIEKENHIKTILRAVLVNIDLLNSIGILHNDVKDNNIMLDSSGRLKFIDFGVSEYMGIAPSTYQLSDFDSIRYFNPDDGKIQEVTIDEVTMTTDKTRSFTIDVYRLGNIILNELLGTKNLKFYSKYDTLYKSYVKRDMTLEYSTMSAKENIIVESLEINNRLLFDLLKCMVTYNSNMRYFADECLKHEYFTGIEYTPDMKISIGTNLLHSNYKDYFYTKERELNYKESQFTLVRDLKFNEMKFIPIATNKNLSMLYGWIIYISYKSHVSPDCIINSFNNINKLLSNTKLKINDENLQIYCFIILMFSNYIIDNSGDIIKTEVITSHFNKSKIYEASKKILSEIDLFKFISIRTIIYELIYKLKENRVESKLLLKIKNKLYNDIINWTMFNNRKQVIISEIVKYSYINFRKTNLVLPELYEEYDLEFLNYCTSIFNQTGGKMLDKVEIGQSFFREYR